MTKTSRAHADTDYLEDTGRSELLALFEQLPDETAQSAFIDYALAGIRFNQMRRYLVHGTTQGNEASKSGLNIVSEMMATSDGGPLGPREQLLWIYDVVLNAEERPGFVTFCDATIGYQIAQVKLGHRTWQDWL